VNTKRSLSRKLAYVPLFVFLVFIAFVMLVPVLWMLLSAVKADSEIISWPPTFFPKVFTLENWETVKSRIPIGTYIKNSLVYSIGTTIPAMLVNSLAGFAFARMRFRGKDVLFMLFLATMMIPFQVIMVPLYIEVYSLGWLNQYAGLIVPKVAAAYWIFLCRSAFEGLPAELEDAGRVDGVSEFGIYWSIMLPLVKPAMVTVLLLSINNCWNDLLWPMVVANTSNMRTLSNGLAMFIGSKTAEYGAAFFCASISMLPMLILYIFGQRYFVAGQASAGIKG
jgi:multiple sugar transport system permease protein